MKRYLLLFLLAIFFTGCLEIQFTHYINPDKSGKVIMEQTSPVNPFNMGSEIKDPEGTAIKEIKKMLGSLEDKYETFGDISYSFSSDSTYITIKATGYYNDYSKVKKEAILPYSFYEKDGKNIFGLKKFFDSVATEAKTAIKERTDTLNLSEEEIEQKAKEMRRSAKMGIGMMKAFMSQMEISSKFVFGGDIKTIDGKSLKDPNSFRIEILGDAFEDELDKLMNDEEYWKDLIRAGKKFDMDDNPFENPASMAQLLKAFTNESDGNKDVSELVIDWEVPLFDYEAEVKDAKEDWEKWKKKIEEYENSKKVEDSKDSDGRKM